MACATACVLSPECHLPEVAGAGAGIEVSLQPPDIAAALTRYLEDPEAARIAGQRGRALVEDQFTWTQIAGALELLYLGVLDD